MKLIKMLYVIVFTLAGVLASAQGFELDTIADGNSGYWPKWDSSYHHLLLYRNTSAPDVPSARIFANDGTSVPIFILHDFHDAKFADIWAASATPEDGIVLSVILGFGQRPDPKDPSKPFPPLESLVLTYGPDGTLKNVWNVAPYNHEALAVDPLGNVFALGTRDAGPEGSPMLIKYSKSGEILGEYFPSSTFANRGRALDGDSLNGSPDLFICDQQLVIWVSSTREIFKFSLNGELQSKFALGAQIDRLAAQNGFAQGTIAGLAVDNVGRLAVEVRFWQSKTSAAGMMHGMVDISPDGTEAKLANPPTSYAVNKQQFLGVSEDGKHVVLERAGKDKAFIKKQ
jgi:hypothetical protein